MEQGEGKSALGNDFMLVRAVHISGKKKNCGIKAHLP